MYFCLSWTELGLAPWWLCARLRVKSKGCPFTVPWLSSLAEAGRWVAGYPSSLTILPFLEVSWEYRGQRFMEKGKKWGKGKVTMEYFPQPQEKDRKYTILFPQ